ncbi:MAG: tRNA 2-thiocytidine biosynthesis protein TtcA [Bacilli bacterium]|nr:tRNA 2-thiocytidine biosynthesis protein TtcA [Bacilli bacterium]
MKSELEVDIYEQAITTKFRQLLWSRFLKAIHEFKLISEGDKICVCISGGKDSMIMAKMFMCLQKFMNFKFEVKYLVMNPGYNSLNLEMIKKNLKTLNIPAEIHETNIFEIANAQDKSPCFLCAKMRRGALYNIAKSMGCNKIALGHHYDDVIETTLMNMLSSGSFQTMLPKLHSTNYEGMELIRPLYYIREKDIIRFSKEFNLNFIQCACRFTESYTHSEDGIGESRRRYIKNLIKEIKKEIPDVEKNLFSSANNVTFDMILGYKVNSVYHSYLENYDDDK